MPKRNPVLWPKIRRAMDLAAAAAMILASAVFIWVLLSSRVRTQAEPVAPRPNAVRESLPPEPIAFSTGVELGTASAKVGVIEFSDFECPFCARFSRETLPGVIADLVQSGKVRLAFRHLPLQQIHADALKAAEASECAHRQGMFWPMHDALFAQPTDLSKEALVRKALSIGLDRRLFEGCLAGEAVSKITQDMQEARLLGIRGTPTFLFGIFQPDGRLKILRRESGALPLAVFQGIVNQLHRSL